MDSEVLKISSKYFVSQKVISVQIWFINLQPSKLSFLKKSSKQ